MSPGLSFFLRGTGSWERPGQEEPGNMFPDPAVRLAHDARSAWPVCVSENEHGANVSLSNPPAL